MIFGVGTDVVEIGRIEKALSRWGERFAERILCAPELNRFRKHKQPASYLAKRFAAKEAFTKALGTGIKAPANWHGVWVTNRAFRQAGTRVLKAVANAPVRARHLARPSLPRR